MEMGNLVRSDRDFRTALLIVVGLAVAFLLPMLLVVTGQLVTVLEAFGYISINDPVPWYVLFLIFGPWWWLFSGLTWNQLRAIYGAIAAGAVLVAAILAFLGVPAAVAGIIAGAGATIAA